jgi:hypothetical protein
MRKPGAMRARRSGAAVALAFLGAIAPRAARALPDPEPPPALVERSRGLVALADRDRDGRASLLEYAAAKLREANGGKGGDLRLTPKHDAYWRGLDANKDGAVSPDELARGHVGDEFRAVDANKDGAIDPLELARALAKLERARRASEEDGFLERFDQDRDGKVARGEFPGPDGVFRRLDRNGDGAITPADRP